MSHIGQAALYHCPNSAGCLFKRAFASLEAFFKHLENNGRCASANARVQQVFSGSDCPKGTAEGGILRQVLASLRSLL